MPVLDSTQRLKKELGLFDVFSISTGAMFSSGFFLLPGLAAAKAGPSVVLAYLIAGILILPAMFSKAELSTALPRAGGTYFFLDRSLGPMVGTIGGLGTYLALTLKTAFALIGIGAYAAFFIDLPIKTVAITLTVVFMMINIFGAKETTALQRILVIILLSVLAFFIAQGLVFLATEQPVAETTRQFKPFLPFGFEGLLSTVGFVFVSYAGLTKVASVAEEVKNPDRNIPLGMMLSLGLTSLVYVAGVFIMVAVLDATSLRSDLTPVATAADAFFHWLPSPGGLILIVAAALAAFASTGNAGLMAASRYPFAMARDRLLPEKFASLGRFKTPVTAIVATGGLMIFFIVVLDEEGIAKLASAFQLFIFMLVNLAVIVMRESRIPSYDPGYKSPLYPWMQVFGIITSILLIAYMGWVAILFTIGIIVICLIWYRHYVRPRVERHGAIYHWFHRLGRNQDVSLDPEFRGIMKEKGLRSEDPFDEIVSRSFVIDIDEPLLFNELTRLAAEQFEKRLPKSAAEIEEIFLQGTLTGATPVAGEVAIPHFRTDVIDNAEMVLVRSSHPISFPSVDPLTGDTDPVREVRAIFYLVSPEKNPGQHLRILAQIAGRVDEPSFKSAWETAKDAQHLREILQRDDHFLTLRVQRGQRAYRLKGIAVRDLQFPPGCLVTRIRREHITIIPRGNTVVYEGDRHSIIGEPESLNILNEKYGGAI